jgi:hypothetical protein
MAQLYEIDAQFKEIMELLENQMYVDTETGECISEEEFNQQLDNVQMALSDKIENTMVFYKNILSDVEQFKIEQKKLMERRKVKENLAERLKNRIDNYITHQYTDENGVVDTQSLNKYKFETPRVKLSYRKSSTVDIKDLSQIPQEYIKDRKLTEDDVKKSDIKKLLTSGKEVTGAELKENLNMQVK